MMHSSSKFPIIFLIVFVMVFLVPCVIWYQQTGNLAVYFLPSVPKGQLIYVLSKLVGMMALLSIAWQIIISLLNQMRFIPRQWLGRTHHLFGLLVLFLGLSHFLLFFTAVSLRQEALAWDLLLPSFKDFYHTHLTFGLVALLVLLAVAIVGIIRAFKLKGKFINLLHRFYWVSISFAYLHALAVGSESQSRAGLALYLTLGAVALILFIAYCLLQYRDKTGGVVGARLLVAKQLCLALVLIFSLSDSSTVLANENKSEEQGLMIVGYNGSAWYPYVVKNNSLTTIKHNSWSQIKAIRNPAYLSWQPSTGYFFVKADDGNLYRYSTSNKSLSPLFASSSEAASSSYTQLRAHANGLIMVKLLEGKSRDTQLVTIGTESLLAATEIKALFKQESAQFHPFIWSNQLFYAHVSCRESCNPLIQEVWRQDMTTGKVRQLTLLNATSYLHSVDNTGKYAFISSNQRGYYHLARFDMTTNEIRWLTKGQVTDSFPSISREGDLYFLRRTLLGTALMVMRKATTTDASTESVLKEIPLPKELQKIRYLELNDQ